MLEVLVQSKQDIGQTIRIWKCTSPLANLKEDVAYGSSIARSLKTKTT